MNLGLGIGIDIPRGGGRSKGSATTAPGKPTGLTVGTVTSTSIALSWTAPASTGGSAITGYKLYKSLAGGLFSLVGTIVGTSTTVTGLTPGTTYYFLVAAANAVGIGATGNKVSQATPTVLFNDLFEGVAGSLYPHPPDVGSSWSNTDSNDYQLQGDGTVTCIDAGTDSMGIALALASSAYPQDLTIEADVVNNGNGESGYVFNYVDALNYWVMNIYDGEVDQYVAGVRNVRITGAAPGVGHYKIVLGSGGTTIKWYIDGVQQGTTYTRTVPSDTKAGLYCNANEAGNGLNWDNFLITTP